MFDNVLARLDKEIDALRAVVQWHDSIRTLIYGNVPDEPFKIDPASLELLKQLAPVKLDWQLFDHYAAVTRIYAVFEQCIIELVEEYVGYLPRIYSGYIDLCQDLRTSHRVGVGHVLMKWSATQPIYGKLTEDQIACGLVDGLRGNAYTLLPEAFLTDSDNYRPDTLNRVFKKIGFDSAFSWVNQSEEISEFCLNELGGQYNPETYLSEFVKHRNDTAHGDVGTVAAVAEIKRYSEFSRLVAKSLADLLRSTLIKDSVRCNLSSIFGAIKRRFTGNIYGVVASGEQSVSVGDTIYVGKKRLYKAKIIGLKVVADSFDSLALTEAMEFGLQLDISVPAESALYICSL